MALTLMPLTLSLLAIVLHIYEASLRIAIIFFVLLLDLLAQDLMIHIHDIYSAFILSLLLHCNAISPPPLDECITSTLPNRYH